MELRKIVSDYERWIQLGEGNAQWQDQVLEVLEMLNEQVQLPASYCCSYYNYYYVYHNLTTLLYYFVLIEFEHRRFSFRI
jgi:iron-sulfur cluster repair protein YtfE (RIC family)